jgi:hypothetical protein
MNEFMLDLGTKDGRKDEMEKLAGSFVAQPVTTLREGEFAASSTPNRRQSLRKS